MQNGSTDRDFSIFYIAGIGCGDSGLGSACAWVEGKAGIKRIFEYDGMTRNQSAATALLDVVKYMRDGQEAFILCDSKVVVRDRSPADPVLLDLRRVASQVIYRKKLNIHRGIIKRNRNPAWALLASKERENFEKSGGGL